MQDYIVTLKTGSAIRMSAAKIESEWPTVRMLDDEGNIVAFWNEGMAQSVYLASATTYPPTPPVPAPEEE